MQRRESIQKQPSTVRTVRKAAAVDHSTSTPVSQRILDLQRTVGNRTVAALVAAAQPKLVVSAANDRLEREADTAADQVMALLDRNVRMNPLLDTIGVADGVASSGLQRRATADAPVAGRSGGEVDTRTETQIGTLRAGGSSLPSRLRSPMEGAFGVDFGKVRLHRGRTSEMLCRKMGAIAFTVGSDVFLGSSAPPLERPVGQHLLAHELSHTIQQGAVGGLVKPTVHRSVELTGLVQRFYGDDPKDKITQDSSDLLYGNSDPRAATKVCLDANQRLKLRTIDEYNSRIGINKLITSTFAALGLFYLREQLDSTAEWGLSAWRNRAIDPQNDDALEKWIGFLRAHKDKVGLVDLGEKGGWFVKAKIDQKHRFKKNRRFSQADQAKGDRLTSKEIRQFLGSPNIAAAEALFYPMSPKKQEALNAWVYRALFRRTSKLGQDFTIKELRAKVHFNTASDPDYQPPKDPDTVVTPTWQDTGVATQSRKKINKNRPITVSEFRHMEKLKKTNPDSFNVYGETPPPPP